MIKTEVIYFEKTNVAVLEHHGSAQSLMHTVGRFIDWRKRSTAAAEKRGRTFGIAYNDPDSVPSEEFRFDVCGELFDPLEENTVGVVSKEIPAGRCVVVEHRGSLDSISESIRSIYSEWLPQSGEILRDFPLFFHYKKRMPNFSEDEQLTIIHVPIE